MTAVAVAADEPATPPLIARDRSEPIIVVVDNRYLMIDFLLVITLGLAGYFSYILFYSADKSEFLIGETSYGHYQIELACSSCHTDPFGGPELIQQACVGVVDSHYATVGAALLKTLGQGLGDAFTDEVKASWAVAYGILAKTMMDAANNKAA